ncbi:MAG: PDZ domain-containing protein, partial [Muribaculaceae bacterium]|nr:PDZ domain-containing protein [Muribaculaceae bacterium]
YVANVEYGTTKQITDTPQQERDLTFGPDGRSIAYAAERGATWGIYESKIVRDDDKSFAYAREIKETPLVTGDETSFQPVYSPDGKELAYLKDRTELCVINLKDKKVRTALDGKYNYSYTDGDVDFVWSPDSRWFLTSYIGTGGWNNQDVALVKADGSEVVNLTESGYTDSNPKWVLGGKAMMWESDRAGYRSHGSWGAESDTYIMFFDADAYDEFRMTKEELDLRPEDKKKDKEEAENDSVDDKKKKKKVKPLKFDLDHRRDRVMRLTPSSSFMGDAVLSPKGDKLYYSVYNDGYNLWCRDLKDWSTKLIIRNVGGGAMVTDAKGEQMFVIKSGRVYKVDVAQGATEPVEFEAEFAYRPSQEREYIFNHAWRQVNDKFYDKDIHGIDWKAYHDNYVRFLPHINNNYDFAEMLSEMLGELNGSHTGARYYGPGATKETAVLGAFYDESYTGDGLKVAEVIADGPLTRADSKITAGCVITSIDGKSIRAGEDYYPLLAGKSGKHVLLGVKSAKGKEFEQMVKPISIGEQNNLLYKRWVRKNREQVDAESGGRVAYVHVRGMDSQSFRNTYSELLGRYRNHDAVIVDTRHNGGGWLHDDLVTLLSGKEYARYEPRGQYIGSDPFNKWLKPSCVLICEDNYSNAHGFPWVYKHQGVGKLIGTRVPGTMTSVWWETQIDPSIVFGIPQVTCVASPE